VIVYLNGAYLPAAQAQVSVFDGGYLYGDGIYTTLRLYRGLPLDLVAHYERLVRHSSQLEIGFDLPLDVLREAIAELVARNALRDTDGRLRITVSRSGEPSLPLPLENLGQIPSTVVMTLTPVAPELASWQAKGIPVICLSEAYARGNFPELKTLNSLATLRALRRAAAAGCPEALLTGPDGQLLEGAVSNIFLVLRDRSRGLHSLDYTLATPASAGEFLAGRTRERILKIAAREDIIARQTVLELRDLATAREVFVVSSVREVLPVVTVDGTAVGEGIPGPVTRLIQEKYAALIARDLREQETQP